MLGRLLVERHDVHHRLRVLKLFRLTDATGREKFLPFDRETGVATVIIYADVCNVFSVKWGGNLHIYRGRRGIAGGRLWAEHTDETFNFTGLLFSGTVGDPAGTGR